MKDSQEHPAEDVEDKDGSAGEAVKDSQEHPAEDVEDKDGSAGEAVKDSQEESAEDVEDKDGSAGEAVKDSQEHPAEDVENKNGSAGEVVENSQEESVEEATNKDQDRSPNGIEGTEYLRPNRIEDATKAYVNKEIKEGKETKLNDCVSVIKKEISSLTGADRKSAILDIGQALAKAENGGLHNSSNALSRTTRINNVKDKITNELGVTKKELNDAIKTGHAIENLEAVHKDYIDGKIEKNEFDSKVHEIVDGNSDRTEILGRASAETIRDMSDDIKAGNNVVINKIKDIIDTAKRIAPKVAEWVVRHGVKTGVASVVFIGVIIATPMVVSAAPAVAGAVSGAVSLDGAATGALIAMFPALGALFAIKEEYEKQAGLTNDNGENMSDIAVKEGVQEDPSEKVDGDGRENNADNATNDDSNKKPDRATGDSKENNAGNTANDDRKEKPEKAPKVENQKVVKAGDDNPDNIIESNNLKEVENTGKETKEDVEANKQRDLENDGKDTKEDVESKKDEDTAIKEAEEEKEAFSAGERREEEHDNTESKREDDSKAEKQATNDGKHPETEKQENGKVERQENDKTEKQENGKVEKQENGKIENPVENRSQEVEKTEEEQPQDMASENAEQALEAEGAKQDMEQQGGLQDSVQQVEADTATAAKDEAEKVTEENPDAADKGEQNDFETDKEEFKEEDPLGDTKSEGVLSANETYSESNSNRATEESKNEDAADAGEAQADEMPEDPLTKEEANTAAGIGSGNPEEERVAQDEGANTVSGENRGDGTNEDDEKKNRDDTDMDTDLSQNGNDSLFDSITDTLADIMRTSAVDSSYAGDTDGANGSNTYSVSQALEEATVKLDDGTEKSLMEALVDLTDSGISNQECFDKAFEKATGQDLPENITEDAFKEGIATAAGDMAGALSSDTEPVTVGDRDYLEGVENTGDNVTAESSNPDDTVTSEPMSDSAIAQAHENIEGTKDQNPDITISEKAGTDQGTDNNTDRLLNEAGTALRVASEGAGDATDDIAKKAIEKAAEHIGPVAEKAVEAAFIADNGAGDATDKALEAGAKAGATAVGGPVAGAVVDLAFDALEK